MTGSKLISFEIWFQKQIKLCTIDLSDAVPKLVILEKFIISKKAKVMPFLNI